MLAKLAQARRQLLDQSFDAGAAENASGVLHNLGNAMTPLAVRLASLQERLGTAPAADIELVLAELGQAEPDTTRKGDLENFLRLSSRDLAQTVTAARGEIEALAHQTQEIQRVLADQQQHARADRVIETLRLDELLRQSAALVSPTLHQRLAIQVDDSLASLGPVRVARTPLLQVFQNLIVNAAEAVRDTGRGHGTLRVSAQVERTAAGEQLHLRFVDDGVGISRDDLPRIFEKGFTTKPEHGNAGIGLHWCANTVNAIGGRMCAESPGPLGGATVRVSLPLQRALPAARLQVA
jgi:signal transduction histidine kinase